MSEIIEVAGCDSNGKPIIFKHEGVVHKGFGITTWLSAGRQAPFCIHMETKRIIPRLTGGVDIEEVKRKIDLVEPYVRAEMEYEEINEILKDKLIHW